MSTPVGTVRPPVPEVEQIASLVARAQAGDGDAFGVIYDRYFDTVFRFVYFRVGSRELAEDITAETFLRALKRIGGFTWQGRDLGAWLVTIARNLVADHYKSARYRAEILVDDPGGGADPVEPSADPEQLAVDHLTNLDLLRALQRLNPAQQECLVLRFLQGLTVSETAAAMGKPDTAIKALQYRAVRSLAQLLPDGLADAYYRPRDAW